MVYPSFRAFMEAVVVPRKALDPSQTRFDGETSGSSREVAGRFRHHGKVWKMDVDSRFEPLFIASEEVKKGHDPFVEETTQTTRGTRLALDHSLWTGFRYLYIYED